jgi:Tol biopolymer transport system component
MDDLPSGAESHHTASEGRLDSWKEIAAYLKRDMTTVQRWEKREEMPVHRHVHDKLGSVYAFRTEIDAWARSRNLGATRNGPESAAPAADRPVPDLGVENAEETTLATSVSPVRARPRKRWRAAWAIMVTAVLAVAAATYWLRERTEYFWRNPVADAQFQHVTDFDGIEQAAAISRDGRFVAFQSDRDGRMDVWVTQVGAGRFYNLTRGRFQEIVNSSVRTLGFSPDGAFVTFWARRTNESGAGAIGVWAVPVLGGEPQPYLDGVAEFDWSRDGSRMVYHTTGAGDPTFVRDLGRGTEDRPIFAAAAGLHAHFPIWSPDQAFIYFVQGEVPDAMDIWRILPGGGTADRITHHNSHVTHPVMLDVNTLMYLATEADGSGPWLYALDVRKRVPHRVSSGVNSYTSLAVSADGRRLVLTLASPKGTLWRLSLADRPVDASAGAPIGLTTGHGFAPRLGPDYLLYASSTDGRDSIWKIAHGAATELWTAPDSRIVGSPDIDPGGRRITFSIEQHGKTSLYVMNADGTDARVVTALLGLRGFPAWAPDGHSITSAAMVNGTPRLFRIALDGSLTPLVDDYAIDPVWALDGEFVVYSGPDIGTTFPVKAVTSDNAPYALPNLTLTRGARRVRFFEHHRALIVMRGDIQHKDLWLIDLDTGAERQLTRLATDFNIRDFDISRDGHEIVLERVQEESDVVILDTVGR